MLRWWFFVCVCVCYLFAWILFFGQCRMKRNMLKYILIFDFISLLFIERILISFFCFFVSLFSCSMFTMRCLLLRLWPLSFSRLFSSTHCVFLFYFHFSFSLILKGIYFVVVFWFWDFYSGLRVQFIWESSGVFQTHRGYNVWQHHIIPINSKWNVCCICEKGRASEQKIQWKWNEENNRFSIGSYVWWLLSTGLLTKFASFFSLSLSHWVRWMSFFVFTLSIRQHNTFRLV